MISTAMLNSNRMVLMAAAAMDIQGDDDEDLKKIMTQNNICWPVFSPVHPHQPDIFGHRIRISKHSDGAE